MIRKLALKFALYSCGFSTILLLVYVAASGPVLHHIAVKKKNTTLMPWRQPGVPFFHLPFAPSRTGSPAFPGNPYVSIAPPSLLSTPEDLYAPLFDVVDRTPLQAPLNKYLQWWGVSSLPVCGNAIMIFAR